MSAELPDDLKVLIDNNMQSSRTVTQSALGSIWANQLPDARVVYKERDVVRTGTRSELGVPFMGGIGSDPARLAAARAEFGAGITSTTIPGKERTAGDLLLQFYNVSATDPNRFYEIQQKLFYGGYYGPTMKLQNIIPGLADDYTMDAYYALLKDTVRLNAAGADVTADERLDERAKALRDQMEKALGGGAGRTIQLTDPAAVGKALDQIATQTVGRKATSDEQRMFVAAFHAMQASAQSATGGTVIMPDLGAQAEAAIREQNPGEAGAHDVANTFQTFLGMLGGLGK